MTEPEPITLQLVSVTEPTGGCPIRTSVFETATGERVIVNEQTKPLPDDATPHRVSLIRTPRRPYRGDEYRVAEAARHRELRAAGVPRDDDRWGWNPAWDRSERLPVDVDLAGALAVARGWLEG